MTAKHLDRLPTSTVLREAAVILRQQGTPTAEVYAEQLLTRAAKIALAVDPTHPSRLWPAAMRLPAMLDAAIARRTPVSVCAVCKQPIDGSPILLNGDPLHVLVCFGVALKRLKTVLRIQDIDCAGMEPALAYSAGAQTGTFIAAEKRRGPKGQRPRRAP